MMRSKTTLFTFLFCLALGVQLAYGQTIRFVGFSSSDETLYLETTNGVQNIAFHERKPSPFLEYKGPRDIIHFFRIETNSEGEEIRIPAGGATLPAGAKQLLVLMFAEKPSDPKTSYRALVVDDHHENFPADSVAYYNFTRARNLVKLGDSEPKVVDPGQQILIPVGSYNGGYVMNQSFKVASQSDQGINKELDTSFRFWKGDRHLLIANNINEQRSFSVWSYNENVETTIRVLQNIE